MKRILFSCASLLIVFLVFARISGHTPFQGKIVSFEKQGPVNIARVKINPSDLSERDASDKPKTGMSVKIIYSIGTAQFRLPVGKVVKIDSDGNLLVQIDESLLDKNVQDPATEQTVKVRSLLVVGADVSVSIEEL